MSNTPIEDVIKLAREAGLAEVTDTAYSLPADYVEALAKLCALAGAKEREEMMGRIRHLLIQAEQRGAEAERGQLRAQVEHWKATEPFGYFRADALGWTDCAETDEGQSRFTKLRQM